MNKKTDNMDMDNAYMRAEQKRQETERHATRLNEFLIYGADIPEDIQKQYGFSEDYRLYKKLEEMDGRQYSEKRQKGEVPDAGKVGGRLTRAVEKAYESICGNWESVESKPDLLIYKEGNAYKVTVFKRSGISRKLKPETYLLQMEDNGNLFMNTGFRIDVAYNEETDILTFSPNGDYIRATPAADNAEDRQ